jgi:hypothetical protein
MKLLAVLIEKLTISLWFLWIISYAVKDHIRVALISYLEPNKCFNIIWNRWTLNSHFIQRIIQIQNRVVNGNNRNNYVRIVGLGCYKAIIKNSTSNFLIFGIFNEKIDRFSKKYCKLWIFLANNRYLSILSFRNLLKQNCKFSLKILKIYCSCFDSYSKMCGSSVYVLRVSSFYHGPQFVIQFSKEFFFKQT